VTELLRRCWQTLRALSGDDAYERYLEHRRAHRAGEEPLSRAEYFRAEQQRKWSGVNRCC
jgi:uncharacterized short protein YbdD (DUF466 family)